MLVLVVLRRMIAVVVVIVIVALETMKMKVVRPFPVRRDRYTRAG